MHGNGIYDGDIIRTDFGHASWWFYKPPKPTGRDGYSSSKGICSVDFMCRSTKIKFPEKDFWFERHENLEEKINYYSLGHIAETRCCEIIGNIHENKDLLK
jgi:hypothetical protein